MNWIAESGLSLGPAQIEEMNEGPSDFAKYGNAKAIPGWQGWLWLSSPLSQPLQGQLNVQV